MSSAKAPCRVCEAPTSADFGICAGTKECRRVREAKRRAVIAAALTYRSCELCGKPTPNECGVCRRTFACQAEYDRRCGTQTSGRQWHPCEVCGGPTASKYGVCQGSDACKQEVTRRWLAANPGIRREGSREYYQANLEARRQYLRQYRSEHGEVLRRKQRQWEAANRAVLRQRHRIYMGRLDRPCANAKSGCTAFAVRNNNFCRPCARQHGKLAKQRKQAELNKTLAERQQHKCPWCGRRLPRSLIKVHVDHVIPRSSGVVIEDEWNLQLLHASCNLAKGSKITPQALALAIEHGITMFSERLAG